MDPSRYHILDSGVCFKQERWGGRLLLFTNNTLTLTPSHLPASQSANHVEDLTPEDA